MISALFAVSSVAQTTAPDPLAWPPITKDNQPGTRWWWMGSAVNPADLARELKTLKQAGIGTVEITPIYGVKGSENAFLEFLSPQWMEMLGATVAEGRRLAMNVDMVTGTGWCFGGPNVSDRDANAVAVYQDEAVSQKPSGVKVKRPAPGGEGWMVNLLYPDAMTRYLERFSAAFAHDRGPKPHAQFHDSYEYQSDWGPDFFDQFERRRGYLLQKELPALFRGEGDPVRVARVRGDYRETVSDLVGESITRWTEWSHAHGFLSRNQAHGSPGNWLDIYAASDIPETEIDFFGSGDILVSKFASSAAHACGKNLVSSETGTWAAEHFTETLAVLKTLCDEFYLAGVNRIMWHGTAYSPAEAPWPGWCFYASTQMNPRNALWHDAPALHTYLARTQGLLQSGRSDNDVLLYWPIHDFWHDAELPKNHLVEGMSVHAGAWFKKQSIGRTAERLWARGYAFDYVSDKLLQGAKAADGGISLGGGAYRAVVVPDCRRMPLETLKKLAALADAGATVIFEGGVPQDVPGLWEWEKRRAELLALAARLTPTPENQLDEALGQAGVRREQALAREGLSFVRRAGEGGNLYFVANRSRRPFDKSVRLASPGSHAGILDPMTGRSGLAETTDDAVRLQLDPGETVFVRTVKNPLPATAARWTYRQPVGEPVPLTGTWGVQFLEGGPHLPKPFRTEALASWTQLGGPEAEGFAGTVLYTLRFDAPAVGSRWILDLGRVLHSARVRLNGRDLGTVFAPPFRVAVDALKAQGNVLEIEVTGTSANRIRDLDRRGVQWKIFHDTNVVNRKYKPFDASKWPVAEQGLLGPVTLQAQQAIR